MLAKKIFIIVPSATLESPVKGAIALANEIVKSFPVTFVTIKKGNSNLKLLNKNVKFIELYEKGNLVKRLFFLRKLISNEGGKSSVVSISFCLSADFINSFFSNVALTFSSIRGNLPKVYENNLGWIGKWIAYFHLKRLKKIDYVISMTDSMSMMVESFIFKKSPVIGNFVDEASLEQCRRKVENNKEYRFVYSGSLVLGKQPELIVSAMSEILQKDIKTRLDIFGDGPLINDLKRLTKELKLDNIVFFHGYVLNPFTEISKADVMLIPSLSEGVSRAALEALYLGVPCVMRDVDGNSELITSGINGELFDDSKDLAKVMLDTAIFSRKHKLFQKILTPAIFRQVLASNKFINIIESH